MLTDSVMRVVQGPGGADSHLPQNVADYDPPSLLLRRTR